VSKQQRDALDALMRGWPLDLGGELATQRPLMQQMMTSHPLPEDVTTEPGELGGVPVVTVGVAGAHPTRVLLYLHGGAYAMGSAAAAAGLASELSRRVGIRAVSVDYRLAPEHPFPAALDDALAAYRGLLDSGVDADRIVLAGESAGAGLAVALMTAIRDKGLEQPRRAVLLSPWADLALTGASMSDRAKLDPALTADALRRRAADYLGDTTPMDPSASPIHADLAGLPPLLIEVGSHEILLDDAVRLAARAARGEVDVTLHVTPGVPHVFPGFAAALDEGTEALDRAASFLRAAFAT